MRMLKWAIRQRTRKGHGVHSPFAYRLITDVLCSPQPFYAFDDIAVLLGKHNISPEYISAYNYLSFRLVNALKPSRVLVVEDSSAPNTPFVLAPYPTTHCVRMISTNTETTNTSVAIQSFTNPIEHICDFEALPPHLFDALFISCLTADNTIIDTLIQHTKTDGFWVIRSNSSKIIKPFRQIIVKDNRIRVVFDMKETLVVFLNPQLSKKTYYL